MNVEAGFVVIDPDAQPINYKLRITLWDGRTMMDRLEFTQNPQDGKRLTTARQCVNVINYYINAYGII